MSAAMPTKVITKLDFYQDVTKNLNQYYYDLQDMMCVKFIKTKAKDYIIEFHIANDEFDLPIRLHGVSIESGDAIATRIMSDITTLVDMLKAYATDMDNSDTSEANKIYVNGMTTAGINFIEKYEVCTMARDDYSEPERELDFVLIGNVSSNEIKKNLTLSKLSLRYTIKKLYPGCNKEGLSALMKRYSEAFIDYCIVRSKDGNVLYQ